MKRKLPYLQKPLIGLKTFSDNGPTRIQLAAGRGIFMHDNNHLLDMDDLFDVFNQLKDIPEEKSELTPEELASQKRYEDIIKKHKAEQ